MKRIGRRTRQEPAISLINIIFLILIFFMVSGTLARPVPVSIELVETDRLECCAGERILAIDREGRIFEGGQAVESPAAFLRALPEGETTVRLAPDRRLPARRLISLVSELRALGAQRIVIVTETTP